MKKKPNYIRICFRIAEVLLLIALLVQHGTIRPNKLLVSGQYSRGVDISHYQEEVDMDALASQNIDFVYCKATDGTRYVDERYEDNCRNAEQAGLLCGAYHFFSLDDDGMTQALHFIRTIGNQNGRLVPAVDVEYYGDKRKNPSDEEKVRTSLQQYLDTLEKEYQRKPVIYTTLPFYQKYIRGNFDGYPLWICNVYFPATLSVGKDWKFWQYDDKTVMKVYQGEEGYIDMGVFHGNRDALEKEMVMKREYHYQFEASDKDTMGWQQYGFLNLYSEDTADKHSLYIGQVIARFGKPAYWTHDYEDLFSQTVVARDKTGKEWYLEAYYGPSGPAITGFSEEEGDLDEEYQAVIEELAWYIMDAKPADFEWQSSYGDVSVKLKMGVKDGKPYYETILSEELEKALRGEE